MSDLFHIPLSLSGPSWWMSVPSVTQRLGDKHGKPGSPDSPCGAPGIPGTPGGQSRGPWKLGAATRFSQIISCGQSVSLPGQSMHLPAGFFPTVQRAREETSQASWSIAHYSALTLEPSQMLHKQISLSMPQ